MKKLSWILTIFLLLALCACAKPPAPEQSMPEAAEPVITESTEKESTHAPDAAAPTEDTDCPPEIAALVENARTGASYEYIYYDVCTTDDERAAFEDDIRTAKDAFKAYLAANWEGFDWKQSESLQAQLCIYDDYSVGLQIYDGNLCTAEFRYFADTGISEISM